MSKVLRTLLIILCILFTGVFIFSGYKLYTILHDYKVAAEKYDGLSGQYVSSAKPIQGTPENPVPTAEIERSPVDVDFELLKAQCKDIVGWIYSPDTVINYPVVRAEDNDYYLHRFIDGSYNAGGSIFVDYTCAADFSTPNTIIYGHHMNDGSMFASIRDYWKEGYYEAHPVLYLNTPAQNYKIELFTGYVTDANSDVYTIDFPNDEYHQWYLEWIRSMSNFENDVQVGLEDKIVTLSTCSYEFDDARYVIQGKLVPIG